MRTFIVILAFVIVVSGYWLWSRQLDDNTAPLASETAVETVTEVDRNTQSTDLNITTGGQLSESDVAASARTQFSGTSALSTAQISSSSRDAAADVERAFRESDDLAILYQELSNPTGPEDIYYRYRILKECTDVRVRGIDEQLTSCENIASATAEGLSATNFVDVNTTASAIRERCYAIAERCANLDFETIDEQPHEALQEAIEQGSVLAKAANLYQLSNADPVGEREWLAAVLAEDPGPELIRHANSYLRSAYRVRNEGYYGVDSAESLRSAELALDLVACRLDNGCLASGVFMQNRCNYLNGCTPWQSYEEWLFQSLASNQEQLNQVLQLAQDYQQFIQNGNTVELLFPEAAE